MTVIDMRNFFHDCDVELIEINDEVIYYAEEKVEEGHNSLFLLEYNRFDHNGQETDNARKKQSATGFSFKSFKSVGIRCRNKEVREDKGCACYPKHDG